MTITAANKLSQAIGALISATYDTGWQAGAIEFMPDNMRGGYRTSQDELIQIREHRSKELNDAINEVTQDAYQFAAGQVEEELVMYLGSINLPRLDLNDL